MNFVRRFSPLAIIIIMVIVQIIETVVVHVSATRWSIWIYLLILNIAITLILLSQTQNYQLRRQDFIRKINDEAENSLNATLDNMPIGVIRFNSETFEPEWFNPFIDMIFKGNDKVINRDDIKKILKNASEDQYITLGKQKYVAELDSDKNLIYLIDATKEVAFKSEFNDSRAVIGAISVDNYDDATDLITDSGRTAINSFIASFLEEFADKYGVYLRRINSSRHYFFVIIVFLKKCLKINSLFLKSFVNYQLKKIFL